MEHTQAHRYGLLGEKLGHSFSPQIHAKLGNSDYGLFAVPKEALDAFMTRREFSGINVTIPYKKAVIPYLSEISERARKIGSVNTIVKRGDGSLSGDNTDYAGLLYAAGKAGISFSGKKVLILGSGGTSLTAQAAAQDHGAREVVVVSRNGNVTYNDLSQHADAEIIVNTTPVGMYPNNGEQLISLSAFPHCCGVIDVIYNPFCTALLQEAEARGIPHTNGLPMLVAQAKYASDLFFAGQQPKVSQGSALTGAADGAAVHGMYSGGGAEGPEGTGAGGKVQSVQRSGERLSAEGAACTASKEEKAFTPDAEIDRITAELYGELSNVVLIGMPSSGKSSIGRLLSGRFGKRFLDLDQMIEARFQKRIPEIFAAEGEAGFREKEALCAREAGKERGAVIAAGGGTVLREENVRALRQNGSMVFIERELSALSTEGRPLSKDAETLRRMYEVRLPIYQRCADISLRNDGTPEDCAEEIERLLQKNGVQD